MSGIERVITDLRALGYRPREHEPGFVTFDYAPELGPLAGETITLGLRPPPSFPIDPPGGLLVRPRLLPEGTPSSEHPYGGVHPASVGGVQDPSFQYWSRPYSGWHTSARTVRSYLDDHVRRLFATLPHDVRRPDIGDARRAA